MILVELLPGSHSSPTRSKQARRLLPNRLTCAVIAVGRQPNLLNPVILLSIIGRLVADRYTAEVVRGWHGKRGHLTCPHPWDSGQPYSPLPRLFGSNQAALQIPGVVSSRCGAETLGLAGDRKSKGDTRQDYDSHGEWTRAVFCPALKRMR